MESGATSWDQAGDSAEMGNAYRQTWTREFMFIWREKDLETLNLGIKAQTNVSGKRVELLYIFEWNIYEFLSLVGQVVWCKGGRKREASECIFGFVSLTTSRSNSVWSPQLQRFALKWGGVEEQRIKYLFSHIFHVSECGCRVLLGSLCRVLPD